MFVWLLLASGLASAYFYRKSKGPTYEPPIKLDTDSKS